MASALNKAGRFRGLSKSFKFINTTTNLNKNVVILDSRYFSYQNNFLATQPIIRPAKMSFSSSALDTKFSESQKLVTTLSEEPDNDVKLKLYALFKQASIGKCNSKKPSALDFVGKAKWQAWTSLGEISQEEAKQQYVDAVNGLLQAENKNKVESNDSSQPQYFGLKVTNEKGVLTILLNRPEKKNALTTEMYENITKIINEADKNDAVAYLVIRGAGDYFCSGNDLSNFTKIGNFKNLEEFAAQGSVVLRKYVESFINFSKPVIGVVNGPAVGIAVTVLGLFDLVYTTDKATLHTPFSALGQSPEGCSSYTFPKLMGAAKANEILMLNKKITATQASELGLVTEVFPAEKFDQEIEKKLAYITTLPKLSLAYAKQMTRSTEIDILRKINVIESERLQERWLSEDCQKAVMSYFQGKSKI